MKYATYCVYLFVLIVLVALLGACRMVAAPATVAGESPEAAATTTDTETSSTLLSRAHTITLLCLMKG